MGIFSEENMICTIMNYTGQGFKSEASFIYDDDEVGVDVAGFPLIHNDKVFFANFQV